MSDTADKNLNGYLCFYRGKKYEIYAETTYEAQVKCATENKIKKRTEITVILAERNGKCVPFTPTM